VIVPASVLMITEPCAMDLYSDGVINLYDFAILAAEWQTMTPVVGDLTGDGKVDMEDLELFVIFWLEPCIVS